MSEEKIKWVDADGVRLTKSVEEWIKEKTIQHSYRLFIGTDSHIEGNRFRFVTVVCLYEEGKGGNYILTTSYEDRAKYKGVQRNRMFREVEMSIEMAANLFEKTGMVAEIHIDASPAEAKHFTSTFSNLLVGYANSFGWEARIKPESWVASAVSDRHTR